MESFPLKKTEFTIVDSKGESGTPRDLPDGARKIVFNLEEVEAARERVRKTEKMSLDSAAEIEQEQKKEEITLTNKIEELSKIEALREQLGAARVREDETEVLAQMKLETQETLTGIRTQKIEENTSDQEKESVPLFPTESQEQKNEPRKEWSGFKKEWFGSKVPTEEEYVQTGSEIMRFSEDLAGGDETYRAKLSAVVYENERFDSLSAFKGITPEGRLILKNGQPTNFAYALAGRTAGRAGYERKLIEGYAREKGIL